MPNAQNTNPTDAVIVAAPAKINLYLHITGKRADGFHLLDSLVTFADVEDTITAVLADDISLRIEGTDDLPADNTNLVLRAAYALRDATGTPQGAHLTLTKRLPLASGMGGGSADAAATLRALNQLWQLNLDETQLARIGLNLGADVPICLYGRTAFMSGIGETITPAPVLPDGYFLLVNPGVHVATRDIFSALKRTDNTAGTFTTPPADTQALATILNERRNDLTEAACRTAPIITEVLKALGSLPGCLLARMTGSGATCFGIFADSPSATVAAAQLTKAHPAWWTKPAGMKHNATDLKSKA